MSIWMILGAALFLLTAVLCRPVLAETEVLLEEPNLKVSVVSAEIVPEGAKILLCCRNRSDGEASLFFLTPKADGVDTVFASGWPSEEIVLSAGEEKSMELVFLPPDGQDSLSLISLRLSFQGQLSSEGGIDFQGPVSCFPCSFSEPQEQVVRSEADNAVERANPVIITDQITPEQAKMLDYGRVWICLRREETLVPFCSIRMKVDADGNAEACYSGTAIAFKEDDQALPLESQEENGEEGTTITTREISMTGESVFYATLILTVTRDQEGISRVTKQEIQSSELGGKYDQAPLGLMDTVEPLLRILEKTDAPMEAIDVQSTFLSVREPLTVRIFPADELGEIWVYCEYFFMDGTDVIHPPYQLTEGRD